MKRFDEVIMQLCRTRKCNVLSHNGNVIEIQSGSFYDDLAYFKAVCDCYMATVHGFIAWIIEVNTAISIIELGYNYSIF